jgi:hypothetical protein
VERERERERGEDCTRDTTLSHAAQSRRARDMCRWFLPV